MEGQSNIKLWYRITFLNLIILSVLSIVAIYWGANVVYLNESGSSLMISGKSEDFASAGELFTEIETLNGYKNNLLYVYLTFAVALYLSFVTWFYKFQDYLRARGVAFDYTNQWASSVWFIPVVNLFYGSKLLKDIWAQLSDEEFQINWAEFMIYAVPSCFITPVLKVVFRRSASYTDFDYGAMQAGYSVMLFVVNLMTIGLIALVVFKLTRFFERYLAKHPDLHLIDHLTK